MTCHDAQPLISRLVDGELPDPEAAALFSHLADCTDCRRFMRDIVRVQATMRRLAEMPVERSAERPPMPSRFHRPAWVSYVAVAAGAAVLVLIGAFGTLAVMRTDGPADGTATSRVVWVLPEREITPSSTQSTWR